MWHTLKALSILGVVAVVYWRSLRNYYTIDDLTSYLACREKDQPRSKWEALLRHLSWRGYWDTPGAKKDKDPNSPPAPNYMAHGMSLGIHALSSVMIYYAFWQTDTAYFAALLFALNPTNNQVSIWLSGKTYGAAAIWCMAAWAWPVLAIPIFAVMAIMPGIYSGIFFPLVFVFRPWPQNLIALLCIPMVLVKVRSIFGVAGNPKIGVWKREDGTITNPEALKIEPKKVFRAIKFYGYYLCNALTARKNVMYQGYMSEFVTDRGGIEEAYQVDRYFVIGICALYLLACNIYPNPTIGMIGLAWHAICIAMWCNLVSTGQQHIALRYTYLANVGLMYFVAEQLMNINPWLIAAPICWYLAKIPSVIKYYQNDWWQNTYQVWEEPNYFYSWLMHGNMNHGRKHYGAAIQDYAQANVCRKSIKAYYNASSTYLSAGHIDGAIRSLEEAKKCDCVGQEKDMERWFSEREELIGKALLARKAGVDLGLTEEDIDLMV